MGSIGSIGAPDPKNLGEFKDKNGGRLSVGDLVEYCSQNNVVCRGKVITFVDGGVLIAEENLVTGVVKRLEEVSILSQNKK